MKRNRKRKNEEEINFWQPASDMFSALLLLLMLVILLMGLYLVQISDFDQKDPDAGDNYAEGDWSPSPTAIPYDFWVSYVSGGGGGGGDETPHPTYVGPGGSPSVSPSPTVTPTPDIEGGGAGGGGGGTGGGDGAGEGPGNEPDMGLKSAVYVMLIDAESERTIKEANVQFELYGNNRALQVLNVYYPERISFRLYETTDNGTFYFPEKLELGTYELHELTEPEGYDASENIEFTLADVYDWADPLVVQVPVWASRNVIRVRMVDSKTNQGISGGVFDVVALTNVITADGTLRYRAGQTVCEIECDEDGYGTSEEIYLGAYKLVQKVAPQYYASILEDIESDVEKQGKVAPPLNSVPSDRTEIRLRLLDEANPDRGIPGAVFSVTGGGESLEVTTNSSGQITLDTLEKGVTYQISQIKSPGDYKPIRDDVSVAVGRDGRFDGESFKEVEVYAHIIRVSIGITDEFSSIQVPNIVLSLFDAATNTMIRSWTTTGTPVTFTNLDAGNYYIVMGDDAANRYDFIVYDRAELQNVSLTTSYLLHYLMYGGIGLAALVLIVFIIVFTVRRRRRRREE